MRAACENGWEGLIFRCKKKSKMKELKILQTAKFLPLGLLAFALACASPPDYPMEPFIKDMQLSKDTLQRATKGNVFLDSTFVSFSFTDGDGDIGDQDSINLFLKDLRDNVVLKNRIPFVPELGASNGIKGQITVKVYTTCCIFPPQLGLDPCFDTDPSFPFDEVVYEIYITDRAGHKSNVLQTAPIYIRCKN